MKRIFFIVAFAAAACTAAAQNYMVVNSEKVYKSIDAYNKAIADLKLEIPELENNIGLYIKSFILNTTHDKGLLARYLELVKTQVALEKQAKDASLQVMAVQAELGRLQLVAQGVMDKSIENANHTLATGRMQLFGTVLLAVAFAFGVAMQLARSIRTPLRQLIDVLNAATQGDMTRRVKYRKQHHPKRDGMAKGGTKLAFGEYGIQALESSYLTNRQIEAARIAMTRHIKRGGKVWINVYPDRPLTKKPAETRMGSGKGSPEWWVANIKPGRVLFELSGVGEDVAREAMRLAIHKLPFKARFIKREAGDI